MRQEGLDVLVKRAMPFAWKLQEVIGDTATRAPPGRVGVDAPVGKGCVDLTETVCGYSTCSTDPSAPDCPC
jgi:hypothetical protein